MAEHPIETARRALREAAAAETDDHWRPILRQMAGSLPDRSRAPWPPPGRRGAIVHQLYRGGA